MKKHVVVVLDENHQIKYSFPTPSIKTSLAKQWDIDVKKGQQKIPLFQENKVGRLEFTAFLKHQIEVKYQEHNIKIKKSSHDVAPTVILEEPIPEDGSIHIKIVKRLPT